MKVVSQDADVFIQMLGEFRVTLRSSPGYSPKFRSRTAENLLMLLALRLGRTISKAELSDHLWPESDGDRQAQNLRRAISDIRQVIAEDPKLSAIVLTQGDRVWLETERVQCDVQQFKALTDSGISGIETEKSLLAAIGLYRGPLLPALSEPWMNVYRMELEERFGQSVEMAISLLLEDERHEEALRLGRHAVVAAPLREDVHIALMRAYLSAGLRSQAICQYEELESLLINQWGELPSPKSVEAFEAISASPPIERPQQDPPQRLDPSDTAGGAMRVGSPFYIERECDQSLKRSIGYEGSTVLIHGTRQVGKTSLLGRVLNEARKGPYTVAVTDFQVLSRSQLSSAEALCRSLAYGFTSQLGISFDLPGAWNEWIGPNSNLDAVVHAALKEIDGPVIWAMDEADLLFGTDYADDFFGLIRGWHNRRAMDSDGEFGKLTLIISYATEAHLFIRDINQSPFNIGTRISVRDFSLDEVRQLSRRYTKLIVEADTRRLYAITGGQPFLTRKALDAIVHNGITLDSLIATADQEDGPFGDHLKRLLLVMDRDEESKQEVIRFLHHKPFLDAKVQLRLIAGGMLIRQADGKLTFRVPAYRNFLARYLAAMP